MSEHAPLRPIAIARPTRLPRPIVTGRGLNAPVALRRSADFVAALTADRGMTGHLAGRLSLFAGRLGAFGGHHRFAAPDLPLDLRHPARRSRAIAVRRMHRWPDWTPPPAMAIPARHEGFIGLPVLPDEAVAVAAPSGWGDVAREASMPVGPGIGSAGLTQISRLQPARYASAPMDTGIEWFSVANAPADLPVDTPLALRLPRVERTAAPQVTPAGGLAAVRRIPAQVETATPMTSVALLGSHIAAQHTGVDPGAAAGGGVSRRTPGELGQPMPLATWQRPVGAERRVRPADQTPAGPLPTWPVGTVIPGAPFVSAATQPSLSSQQRSEWFQPAAAVGGSRHRDEPVSPLSRTGEGARVMAATYPLPLARTAIPAGTGRLAPSQLRPAVANLAADVIRRADWLPLAAGTPTGGPRSAAQSVPTSMIPASTPTSRSMRVEPLAQILVAPLPTSTLPAPSREAVWRTTSLPNLLSVPPVAGPAELPMVSRRLAFGADRVVQAATGAVSAVWGPLGQYVAPAGTAVQTTPYAGLIGSSDRPLSRSVRSTPPAAPPPTRPVVYRSPLPDRAEPTEIQRTQAAEAIAASTGQPLPPIMRRSMEHLIGMDLASVRVHSGPAVQRATDLVAARAMASGTDVFLPGGIPDSPAAAGAPLLAHELTHVAHHLGHRPPTPPAPMTLARRFSGHEREADAVERSVADVQRFGLPGGLGGLPSGLPTKLPSGLPQSAMTLARPLISQAQSAAKSALQDAEQAVADKLPVAQIKDALAAVTGAPAGGAEAPNPAQLAEQVYQLLERRLLVERERAGIRR